MIRWAQLTWQAASPEVLAAALGRRLGAVPEAVPGGAWRIRLGGEAIEVVPWRREGPRDDPTLDGRLVFEPIDGGGPEADAEPGAPLVLAGIAWATVELDRAEAELDPWLAPPAGGDGPGHPDPHLGAHTRLRRSPALSAGTLVLAEPSTEGRLAASLARDGEGPCALYVRPATGLDGWIPAARARGITVSARRRGPLGTAVILPGTAIAGPHILVVDVPVQGHAASTIAP